MSSAEGARIEAALRVYGVEGQSPLRRKLLLGLEMRNFLCVLRPICVFSSTSRSRPPVRLPSLIFQADCGSIKGAGVPAEEGTEYYLLWYSE